MHRTSEYLGLMLYLLYLQAVSYLVAPCKAAVALTYLDSCQHMGDLDVVPDSWLGPGSWQLQDF